MKLGVFLCTCNKTLGINFKDVKKAVKAEVIEVHDQLCGEDGLAYIIDDFRRKELDLGLVACASKKQIFESLGLSLVYLSLREHCAWVHEGKEATEKAKGLLKAAINRGLPKPEKISIDGDTDILITGDLSPCLRIADILSKIGDVKILTDRPVVDSSYYSLPALYDLPIKVGTIRNVRGRIGDFTVEITSNPIDINRCISCGECAKVCPRGAVQIGWFYFVDSSCDGCGQCTDVCPAGAIQLEEKASILKAGQILAIGAWDHLVKRGIYVADKNRSPADLALEAVSNMGKNEREKILDTRLEGCASGKSEITGCRLCETSCPHDAITREGNLIVFDEAGCEACGYCASICPISLPQLRNYSDGLLYREMESLLACGLSRKVLMFTCMECGLPLLEETGLRRLMYPPVLPLLVPCIGAVSEAHILRALDLGADGVLLLECKECKHHIKSDKAAGFASKVLDAFHLGRRLGIIRAESLEEFVESIYGFYQGLAPSPLIGKPVELEKTGKRDVILSLLQSYSLKTGIRPELLEKDTGHPYARISINSGCTVCEACINMCPTGAIRKHDGRIDFMYGYCIACTLCEQACPEKALKLDRTLDLSSLIDQRPLTVFESEVITCVHCKKPYITKAAYDRLSERLGGNLGGDFSVESQLELLKYCENCRPMRALEKLGLY